LSKPTEKFQLFVGVELFQVFPYLLPCIVAALIALIGAIVGFYFLDEVGKFAAELWVPFPPLRIFL